jgi:hypothetical protein
MVCAGACYDMEQTMEYAPYSTGAKYCSECRLYLFIDLLFVDAAIKDPVLNLRKDFLTLMDSIMNR